MLTVLLFWSIFQSYFKLETNIQPKNFRIIRSEILARTNCVNFFFKFHDFQIFPF